MDREIWVLGSDRSNKPDCVITLSLSSSSRAINEDLQLGSFRFEKSSHIFDTEHVDAFLNQLVHEIHIVLKGILGLLGIGDVTAVAYNRLADTASLLGGIDAEFHLSEQLKSRVLTYLNEWSYIL